MNKILSILLCACLAAALSGCSTDTARGGSSDGGNAGSSGNSAEGTGNSSGGAESVVIESGLPLTSETGSSIGNVGELVFVSGDKIAEITIRGFGTVKAKLFTDIAPISAENFIQLAERGYYDGLKIHRVIEDFMMQGGSLNGDGTGGTAAYSGEGSNAVDFGIEIDSRARHFYGALCYANALGRNDTQFYIVNNNQPQVLSELPEPGELKSAAAELGAYKAAYEKGSVEYKYYGSMEEYYTNLAAMIENMSQDVIDKYNAEGGTPSLDGGYTVFGQVYEGFDVIDAISAVEVGLSDQGEESKPVQDIIIESVKIVTYSE